MRGLWAERADERMHEHHAKKFFPSPEIDGGRERARERRQEITLPKRPTAAEADLAYEGRLFHRHRTLNCSGSFIIELVLVLQM